MAHGGEDHRIKIRIQTVLLQPVGNLMLADEVGNDAQFVATAVEAPDNLRAAVHHHPASLGLPVLEAQLMAHLPDADRVIIRQ